MVEEIQRLSRVVRFQPEGNFTEFYGEWVQVNAINTGANDVT